MATPMTEDEAVALALQNSPEVHWRGYAVEESEALTQAGLAWNNPVLRVGGLRYDRLAEPAVAHRSYGDHPFEHTTVGLRWAPPGLGERAARRAEGRAREADARMELVIARRDTVALVRTLHAQVLSYDAQIALVKDVVEQRETLRALVQHRLTLQAATLLDQSLTDVDYLEARTQLVEIEGRRRAAYDELLIQLGLPAEVEIDLAPATDTCAPPSDVRALTERAWQVNPHLHVLEAERLSIEAEQVRSRRQIFPWLDYVQLSYGLAGTDRSSYVAFQFQLMLPLLDWKGPRRQALRAHEHALLERIQTENRALSERVVRTRARLAEQAALVEHYRDAASVVERGVADLRKTLAQAGPTNLLEIVQLQARLLATRRAYVRAQLECKLQQIELDRLTRTGLGGKQ
jgi:outer membrane protein TolC